MKKFQSVGKKKKEKKKKLKIFLSSIKTKVTIKFPKKLFFLPEICLAPKGLINFVRGVSFTLTFDSQLVNNSY